MSDDGKEWDAPAFPGGRLDVRTANEANLFVDVQRGAPIDTRIDGDTFQILAETPEGRRLFSFWLQGGNPPDAADLGDGTSTALTPLDLVLFGSRVERELPDPPARTRHHARRLHLGASALRQAARFAGDGDALPESAFAGPMGKRMYLDDPDRFQKAALLAQADRLDALAAQWAAR